MSNVHSFLIVRFRTTKKSINKRWGWGVRFERTCHANYRGRSNHCNRSYRSTGSSGKGQAGQKFRLHLETIGLLGEKISKLV